MEVLYTPISQVVILKKCIYSRLFGFASFGAAGTWRAQYFRL